MKRTIYVQSDDIWEGMKLEAKRDRRSVSGYLVGLHLDFVKSLSNRIKAGKSPEAEILKAQQGIEKAKVEKPVMVAKKVEAVDEDAWRVNIRPIPKKGV